MREKTYHLNRMNVVKLFDNMNFLGSFIILEDGKELVYQEHITKTIFMKLDLKTIFINLFVTKIQVFNTIEDMEPSWEVEINDNNI